MTDNLRNEPFFISDTDEERFRPFIERCQKAIEGLTLGDIADLIQRDTLCSPDESLEIARHLLFIDNSTPKQNEASTRVVAEQLSAFGLDVHLTASVRVVFAIIMENDSESPPLRQLLNEWMQAHDGQGDNLPADS